MPILANSPAELSDLIAARTIAMTRPFIVALDGRSGAGKSTLAAALADQLDAAIVEGDDFYAGGIELRSDSAASRAAACIDWTRQRAVLEALTASRKASWHAFDWDTFDGRLRDEQTVVEPRPVVILEGVYAARPELAGFIDMRVALIVPDDQRLKRLAAREGTIGPWERQWHEAEDFYFADVMPLSAFDVIAEFGGAEQCAPSP
ncbi:MULTISPECIES: (d)CMP kinase [unclassified Chelatococcus]|uniref:uridine kinase family protein n=1 Tax=unclassified Chelatococcus TaxID=2638111 RepID=UPI001BD18BE8|nr:MULTISPECIES: (d)CMP kinase [unclassified Chelatococcus]MBS7700422.1 AAA family ATPase [Chelatococcus sp. YT9]MBX3556218.1 AAA family ATPase [Chelatococcus sp.]